MEDVSKLRIRSAMVIYEFERALARYIKDRNIDVSLTAPGREIINRVFGNSLEIGRALDVDFILENSYISETLQLAELASASSSQALHIKRLRSLCDALELFDIRNAVSHPNRQFPECYWYRCCTLASDPVIGLLGLLEVCNAWGSALAGKIEEPPEEWLAKPRWTVPTLLPTSFEHSATGLIGRRKDIDALLKELKNPRAPLVSIVARGGIGKTSLALQALSDFCISAESASFLDGVVFVSMKCERLTATGIEPLTAPLSISDLCDSLLEQLDDLYGGEHKTLTDALVDYEEKRTCLFIDNLETLLRDTPKQFLDLYERLPPKWKVIVTSRIPVEGAKNMPLNALDEGGAVALARGYFSSKGVSAPGPETIERLISICDRNPLAIRLSIDRYTAGAEIDVASQEVQQDVIAFSFSNLLEVLSPVANHILEALFVLEIASRSRLCEALSTDVDAVSTAISELARTSLIIRQDADSGEQYSLGTSIRELLRSSPRNLKIRGDILDWVSKSNAAVCEAMRSQKERNVSPLDSLYIPADTAASSIGLSKEVVRATKRDDFKALAALEVKTRQHIEEQGASSFLHRIHARVLVALEDRAEAEKALRAAIQSAPSDPSPVLFLTTLLMRAGKYSEAESYAKDLIDKGWGNAEKSGEDVDRLWSLYLQALNWQDKLDDVFGYTQHWKNIGLLEATYGIARAHAYRRQADRENRNGAEAERIWKLVCNALITLDYVVRKYGYSSPLKSEIKKNVGDIAFYLRKNNFSIPSDKNFQDISAFLKTHANAVRELCAEDMSYVSRMIPGLSFGSIAASNDGRVSSPGTDINLKVQKLSADGFKIVTIHHIPKTDGFPHYLFAFDSDDNRYYLNHNAFEGGNFKRWVHLQKGSKVAIRYMPAERGRAAVATEIVYVG